MATITSGFTRRELLKRSSGLLIGFSLIDPSIVPRALASTVDGQPGAAFAAGAADAATSPARLDAWLKIDPDGVVHVFTGKVEIGMGVETALSQIVAEELDVPIAHVRFVMGDTAHTPDQGGVGGSTSVSNGAKPLRNAAATARAVLVQAAAEKLGAPAGDLTVRDGVIFRKTQPSSRLAYGDIAGSDTLQDSLKVTGAGFSLNVEGTGKPKDPATYIIVGTSVPRVDIAPKVFGTFRYITDVRVPDMLHGRVIRPSGTGATFVRVDETEAKRIRGYVRTIVKQNFVGVLAETEWAAIKAAEAVKVTWSEPAATFPGHDDLYAWMRKATPKATRETMKRGDVDAALAGAARRIEASYEFPFQSHATMGPGCAVADVRANGDATIWSGAQKPHALRKGLAGLLGLPVEQVRIVWVEDAGSYGRPGFEDAAADAALLSQIAGRPVRVQWMRDDMTAWGSKGPAVACDLAAALDDHQAVTAVRFTSRAFSGGDVLYQPSTADNFLAALLSGIPNTSGVNEFVSWGGQTPAYAFPNLQSTAHVIPSLYAGPSPLRTTHLRDPEGPAASFAVESFVDELAAAAGIDPIDFRLKWIEEPRANAVLIAAAEKAGWQRRPSARPAARDAGAEILRGRGVALGTRNGTYVGTIAEVEVNRRTGTVRVTRFVCAHDCGLIVNPTALKRTIEANLVQSLSRAIHEEVAFDEHTVTSVDWRTYPIARIADVPPVMDVILIDHRDLPPGGAGEPSSRPTAAAIANAVFDATGVRIRRAPLTAARVKAALQTA
jgi:CO/xanthine dehydrogenase Mo-binding subunit